MFCGSAARIQVLACHEVLPRRVLFELRDTVHLEYRQESGWTHVKVRCLVTLQCIPFDALCPTIFDVIRCFMIRCFVYCDLSCHSIFHNTVICIDTILCVLRFLMSCDVCVKRCFVCYDALCETMLCNLRSLMSYKVCTIRCFV